MALLTVWRVGSRQKPAGGKAPTIVFSSFLLWGPASPGEEGEEEVGRDFVGTPENIRRGRREGGGRELAPATGTA